MSGPERLTPAQRAEYFLAREDLPTDSMRHARLAEMVRTAMHHARTAALDEAAMVARKDADDGIDDLEVGAALNIATAIEALKG